MFLWWTAWMVFIIVMLLALHFANAAHAG